MLLSFECFGVAAAGSNSTKAVKPRLKKSCRRVLRPCNIMDRRSNDQRQQQCDRQSQITPIAECGNSEPARMRGQRNVPSIATSKSSVPDESADDDHKAPPAAVSGRQMIFHGIEHQYSILGYDADNHDHAHQRNDIQRHAGDE